MSEIINTQINTDSCSEIIKQKEERIKELESNAKTANINLMACDSARIRAISEISNLTQRLERMVKLYEQLDTGLIGHTSYFGKLEKILAESIK